MNETSEIITRAIIIIGIGIVLVTGLLVLATRPTFAIAIYDECLVYQK